MFSNGQNSSQAIVLPFIRVANVVHGVIWKLGNEKKFKKEIKENKLNEQSTDDKEKSELSIGVSLEGGVDSMGITSFFKSFYLFLYG